MKLLRRNRTSGFSLIELLIVVTIILIIAAIAIPKLLTVKQQANATAAVGNLKTLNNALNSYASQYASIGYPTALTILASPATGSPSSTNAALIDDALAASGTTAKQGYLFTYTPATGTPSTSYTITAAPQTGASNRYYFMDQDGVIRYNDGSAATVTSTIIG